VAGRREHLGEPGKEEKESLRPKTIEKKNDRIKKEEDKIPDETLQREETK